MKIEIVSGQENVDIDLFFRELLKKNKVSLINRGDNVLVYPEQVIAHDNVIVKRIRKIVGKHIEQGIDLYVITYSEIVLLAICLEIKARKFSGAQCHQVLENGQDICTPIETDGFLTERAFGVFDTKDDLLAKLLSR